MAVVAVADEDDAKERNGRKERPSLTSHGSMINEYRRHVH